VGRFGFEGEFFLAKIDDARHRQRDDRSNRAALGSQRSRRFREIAHVDIVGVASGKECRLWAVYALENSSWAEDRTGLGPRDAVASGGVGYA